MSGRGWCVLLALPFLLPAWAHAQEKRVRTIAFEDLEVFCHILHQNKQQRLTALRTDEELHDNPTDTILILFGNPKVPNAQYALERIRVFRERGGAVLLATDRPLDHPQLPIQISGEAIQREHHSFGGRAECPWLARPDDLQAWDPKHPIFQLVTKGIATNCPSNVQPRNNKDAAVRPLLTFPVDNWVFGASAKPHYIVGSSGDAPPSGRALYIAGHGIFMNGMLMQSAADNFRFAVNVVDWLAEAPNGKPRSKALLIVDGTIVPDFDMKLTPPPPPLPIPPRAIINRLLRDLQEEGRIQQIFHDSIDQDGTLAVGLSIFVGGLLIYGAKKVLEGRRQIESSAPRMVGKVAPAAPSPQSLKAQQAAALRQANFRREARQIARAWLEQEFGVEPERWSADMNAQLRVQRYFWSLGATHAQADLVLRMARIANDVTVSQREFLLVHRALQDLGDAARDGRVTLLIDGKYVRKAA